MVWIPAYAGMTAEGGRCRLKLHHSCNFSSFPQKRESRTFKFSDDF
ncbi:hypothetical protein NEILACOT_04239 [Neisseria lactamica ATCC 23970]|uniref:Uncharacterized protein n=1 Tax=Neisseria lactamica ATCC 23970 TaxID=546265 RepID=D0W9M7_NEILA|nr:hypothetical protein NEILACOT_04239 [Neisseria lactamica ATCC 23970]